MAVLDPLEIATDTALAVEVWARLLYKESLQRTFLNRFLGDGPDALFVRVTDLSAGPGDTVRHDIVQQQTGYGVSGNTQLKGSEEQLAYFQQETKVEQKRQGLAHVRMSQQRTIHDLRRDSMFVLRDFFARVFDEYLAAHLIGATTATAPAGLVTDIDTTHGANPLAAPTSPENILDGTGGPFSPDGIDAAKWAATQTANYVIRPINVDGDSAYIMFLHPYQASSLTQNTDWRGAQEQGGVRGDRNKVFSGMLGMWNGVILHAWGHLPTFAADEKRAVLCGAGAGTVAFGGSFGRLDRVNRPSNNELGVPFYWAEEIEDYGNEIGISAGTIFGIRKNVFNSDDHATMVVQSTDTAPTP